MKKVIGFRTRLNGTRYPIYEWHADDGNIYYSNDDGKTLYRHPKPEEFQKKLEEAKESQLPENKWRVDSTHSLSEYDKDQLYVTPNGSVVAIDPDGDIISLCKKIPNGESGHSILQLAISKGGNRLDAFGKRLYEFYTRNGFEPVSWTKFSTAAAPSDWRNGIDQEEDIVFYKYTGKSVSMSYNEFRDSRHDEDYNQAKKTRDGEMK